MRGRSLEERAMKDPGAVADDRPLLSKDIMAFVNAYKSNGGCFNSSSFRRVGKGAGHNADPSTRSSTAPCPRVGRGREKTGVNALMSRVQTTDIGARSRDCAPLPTLVLARIGMMHSFRKE